MVVQSATGLRTKKEASSALVRQSARYIMASAQKKVIVRRFLGDVLAGYLPVNGFVQHGDVGLLDLDGRINSIPLSDVKYICYVRDFNLGDNLNPERLSRRAFLARPRSDGLWIRLTFCGSHSGPQESRPSNPRVPDLLEGLAASDVSLLNDLLADLGLHLTPPDTRSNTQRIFIPRSSFTDLQILAVITSPSRRKLAQSPTSSLQDELFSTPLPPSTH